MGNLRLATIAGGQRVKLEALTKGARVRGLGVDGVATVKSIEFRGQNAAEVIFTDARGGLRRRIGARDDEPALDLLEVVRAWSFNADGDLFRVVSEARHIELAGIFDPYVVSTSSTIEPSPHQMSAVYQEMLPRQPIRFLLADDPGTGKSGSSLGIERTPAPSIHDAFQCEEAEWRW